MTINRRFFIEFFTASGLGASLFPGVLYTVYQDQPLADDEPEITVAMIEAAEKIAGLSFTPEEREMMLDNLKRSWQNYQAMREVPLPNHIPPAIQFDLRAAGAHPPSLEGAPSSTWEPPEVTRPNREEDLAFMSVAELSGLIKSGQVTSTKLTQMYLSRLKRHDNVLQAVVSYTEERALKQAAERDEELKQGQWRGPLHGIPWGAKDLLSVKGAPTTWGAMPYRDQVIDEDADVVKRLDEAGAVLVAKLTLGALAMGDVWFAGVTKNPWNIEQGSSGSSAGPGSAVAAGLVGFAIGSETLGSIVSPSTRNGVSGHRPTFGRVSRGGAMALSWTMDKLGPMCRAVEDCALVFEAIHGKDIGDPTSVDAPFHWPIDAAKLRVGYLNEAFDADRTGKAADLAVLTTLRGLGFNLKPMTLPDLPVQSMLITLSVEAAAAFDELTRTKGVDTLVRQQSNAWPNMFRSARMVPAVEYVQANRLRTMLMREMEAVMEDVDVFVTPSYGGGALRITNLTGHPTVVVPNRFDPLEDDSGSPRRQPGSISFIGGLYQDAETLALAHAYQQATDFHKQRPPIQ